MPRNYILSDNNQCSGRQKGLKMVEKAFTPSTSIYVLCLEKVCQKFKLHCTLDMKRHLTVSIC